MPTLPQLAARTLRKLSVALVPDAERPAAGATVTADDVAGRVLRELGVIVADADRPASLPPVDGREIAARALRAVGVNPAGADFLPPTGTVYTYQQLADAALIKLGVIAANENASAEDKALANARVIDAHDQLSGMGYVAWAVNQIPSTVAEAYIVMAANLLAPSFGRPATMETFTAAQEMVRRVALSGPYGLAIGVSKVEAVHANLAALGLVSWPIGAVPLAFAEHYVAMAAYLLGPVVGKPSEKAAWDAAEQEVRRLALIGIGRQRATELVSSVQAELNAAGLISWDADHIPLSLYDAMASMVAIQLAPQFGKDPDPKAYAAAEQRVWRVSMGGAAGQKLAEQKVLAVQQLLEARGIARWSIWDVPDHVAEPIVCMAAVWLAPEMRAQADANWWPASERVLHQMVALPTDYSPIAGTFF